MDANTWHIISIIGYSLAGVLFVVAIIMFFMMNIIAIIGDLTGRTAAKQIREIRKRNSLTRKKRYQPDAFKFERGTLTERVGRPLKFGKTAQAIVHASKRLDETSQPIFIHDEKTDGIVLVISSEVASTSAEATEVLGFEQQAEGTQVLGSGNGTERKTEASHILGTRNGIQVQSDRTQVWKDDDCTEILSDDDGTSVLYPTTELEEEQLFPVEFKIVKNIKVIHTTEEI